MKENNASTAWHNLTWDVRRSVRYHDRRVKFFDRIRKLFSTFALLSGSAAIITAVSSAGHGYVVTWSALVAISSALDLIFDPAGYARLHDDLKRRFIHLERDIVASDHNNDNLKRITSARLEVEADEPPVLRVLDVICHNEMLRAMGYDDKHVKKIGALQRFFAPFFDLSANKIN